MFDVYKDYRSASLCLETILARALLMFFVLWANYGKKRETEYEIVHEDVAYDERRGCGVAVSLVIGRRSRTLLSQIGGQVH